MGASGNSAHKRIYIFLYVFMQLHKWVPAETRLNAYTYFYMHLGKNLNLT
jgi:hypothetical protein